MASSVSRGKKSQPQAGHHHHHHHHADSFDDTRNNMPQILTLDHVSPATRLLEKRRQMFEVQEALDAQKEEFARREDAFRRREEGLRKKDIELQESLIKFNKFLQENESKRNRAVKRASDERKQRETKDVEISRLEDALALYQSESRELGTKVVRNLKYSQYLERVQESVPEDYPEITDLVNRYNTLRDANVDLSASQRDHELETDVTRAEFGSYTKLRTNDILNSNNTIARYQKALEGAEAEGQRLQQSADATVRSASEQTLELGQILMTIRNLVERATSGIHGALLKHTETGKQQLESSSATEAEAQGNTSPVKGQASHSSAGSHLLPSLFDDSDLLVTGAKAVNHLDVLGAYMMDFTSIVDTHIEAQQRAKRQAQQQQ